MQNPEVRRSEIMDAAEELFFIKGYHDTKVIDVMNKVGVAKGTFYYYFKSKEEVLDAIIDRIVEQDVADAQKIVDDPGIPVFEKLFQVLLGQRPKTGGEKERMLRQIHQSANAEMHQKTLVRSVLGMAPVLARIVEQGIAEGVMHTGFPGETMEFLVASGQILFDEGLFQWEPEAARKKAAAFVKLMELSLGAEKGSFDYMAQLLTEKADTK